MKLKAQWPTTKLGKASLLLIALTFVAWVFVNNAQNCLDRDFMEKAPPAVCWRATNDYESTIGYSELIYLVLLASAIICSTVAISRFKIKRSYGTPVENRKAAGFLAAISIILLIFVVTIFEVWQRTTFNNNNYFLNTVSDIVIKVGVPFWLVITTSAITHGLSSFKRSDR